MDSMWPWGHLATGYLAYTSFVHLRYGRRPAERPTVALAVGTQLPDLVDKPLAWTLEILPHGRSLGHSLFTAVGVALAVRFLLGRREVTVGGAFVAGYLLHLLGDSLQPLLDGEFAALRFLFWPVIPAVKYETTPSVVGHVLDVRLTPGFSLEIGFALLTLAIWYVDRRPGLATILHAPRLAYRTLSLSK